MSEGARKVRFGILVQGPWIEAWQARSLGEILRVAGAAPSVVVVPEPNHARRDRRVRDGLLFRAYRRLRPSRALRREPLGPLTGNAQTLKCRLESTATSPSTYREDDVDRLGELNLDFLLDFGGDAASGGILTAARRGLWSFSVGDARKRLDGALAFWEVYDGEPVTRAALERRGDSENMILRAGFFPTQLGSYAASLDTVLFGCARWPASVCRDLLPGLEGGPGALERTASPALDLPFRTPTNAQMFRLLSQEVRHVGSRLRNEVLRQADWGVGIVREPIQAFLRPGYRPRVDWIPPLPGGVFLADPFGIARGGTIHLFGEVYDYRTSRGSLVSIPVPDRGPQGPAVPVLPQSVHASYPYLFEHDGAVYCVPETSAAREVRLYRAVELPARWEFVTVLLPGVAGVDGTVFRHGGRWWLACADGEVDPFVHLYLWHSPDLTGPWQPHSSNPVKADVRSARPGGTPFMHEGTLYRPAQDCSRTYGGRLVINRVTRLTPEEFEEEVAAVVEPFRDGPYPEGAHTLSAVGDVTLIDGKRYARMPGGLVSAVRRGFELVSASQ